MTSGHVSYLMALTLMIDIPAGGDTGAAIAVAAMKASSKLMNFILTADDYRNLVDNGGRLGRVTAAS